jgi:hypothetical protein
MLFPAALGALAAALWLARPGPAGGELGAPQVGDPDSSVPALGGRLEGAEGTALVARLAPMHADPGRQAFEAGALASRLGLAPGAPYRLSLSWERGELEDAGAVLHLGSISVRDAAGTALAPIPGDEDPSGDGDRQGEPGDPVRALFRAPRGTLGPGEAVDWILWGREPRGAVRLVGLLPAGTESELLAERTGLSGALPLEPLEVRRSELVLPVARLDRSEGKTAAAPSSEDAGEARATGH